MNGLSKIIRVGKFNSSRFRLKKEICVFANRIPKDALILDDGSGDAPYKEFFSHGIYESADFGKINKKYEELTYTCDLANIPVEDCRYDFVIFNQVMEHLPEPKKVLYELHRVLKRGGLLFASAPLFYEEHEQPYDFFRYTSFAWEKMITEVGFEIEKLDWLEGYYGTLGYQFSMMFQYLPKWKFLPFRIICKFISVFFHYLETRKKLKVGMPKNYFCITKKNKNFSEVEYCPCKDVKGIK